MTHITCTCNADKGTFFILIIVVSWTWFKYMSIFFFNKQCKWHSTHGSFKTFILSPIDNRISKFTENSPSSSTTTSVEDPQKCSFGRNIWQKESQHICDEKVTNNLMNLSTNQGLRSENYLSVKKNKDWKMVCPASHKWFLQVFMKYTFVYHSILSSLIGSWINSVLWLRHQGGFHVSSFSLLGEYQSKIFTTALNLHSDSMNCKERYRWQDFPVSYFIKSVG